MRVEEGANGLAASDSQSVPVGAGTPCCTDQGRPYPPVGSGTRQGVSGRRRRRSHNVLQLRQETQSTACPPRVKTCPSPRTAQWGRRLMPTPARPRRSISRPAIQQVAVAPRLRRLSNLPDGVWQISQPVTGRRLAETGILEPRGIKWPVSASYT